MPLSPKVGEKLAAKLSKKFAAEERFDEAFGRNEITFFTDENGEAKVLFIGERRPDGTIKGDRFARRLVRNEEGKILKDHWDYKGRT